MSPLPVVAIVGRPNVGKSTLFNRVVGSRTAIVEDRARTTRDRIYADAEWNGREFVVVDTGGLEIEPGDAIEARVQEQARIAIAEADVIIFVVDAMTGITPADQEAAELLRLARAPVIVAPNKADNERREQDAVEFFAFGWSETYPISAAHGRSVADLLDAVVEALPPESAEELERKAHERETDEIVVELADAVEAGEELEAWDAFASEPEGPVAISIVGRPNVGKSSLLNALLGQERSIVSPVPGTTRDAIDTRLEWGRGELLLIDTAGIRRRGKVASGPAAERYSTLRALKAIARADVAVLVVDAVEELTAQDAHVAGYVVEEGKGLVLAINKWDLVAEKTGRTFDEFVARLRRQVPFLDFAPVVSISALTGQRVDRVLELAVDVWSERRKRVPTPELNRLLSDLTNRQPPPMVRGKRARILYATQVGVAPPTFVFFGRDMTALHFSYRRFIENRIRDRFGFDGTPIRLVFRERGEPRGGRRPIARSSGARAGGTATRQPRPSPSKGGGSRSTQGSPGGGKGSGATGPAPTSRPGRPARAKTDGKRGR